MPVENIIELNKKAYDLIARRYAGDEPAEDDPEMRMACRKLFESKLHGKNILEIGCGPGVDSSFFNDDGFTITATDISCEFIKIVNERYPHIEAFQMDMTSPNINNRKFDGIYAFASFLHIPREQALNTLKHFKNLLNIKGVLFLMIIESNKVSEYCIDNWGGVPNNKVLFTCYSQSEISKLLADAGFTKIEIHFSAAKSKKYEDIPRLTERGVIGYEVLAFV